MKTITNNILFMLSLTILLVDATLPCGPAHCDISCTMGQMCKDKKIQMVCVENQVAGKEDVCCKNFSCSGKASFQYLYCKYYICLDKIDHTETKGPTGKG